MYRHIENWYIRKNIFSVKYLEGGKPKEVNLMFDDDYDFNTFDLTNFENFDYSNGYLRVVFEGDFFYVKSNEHLLVKIYAPKEVRKQIRKDVETMGYFDINYRKHFKPKYAKCIKEIWVGQECTEVYSNKEYQALRKKALTHSSGQKEFIAIYLAESIDGINYTVSNRKGEQLYAGTISMDQ